MGSHLHRRGERPLKRHVGSYDFQGVLVESQSPCKVESSFKPHLKYWHPFSPHFWVQKSSLLFLNRMLKLTDPGECITVIHRHSGNSRISNIVGQTAQSE